MAWKGEAIPGGWQYQNGKGRIILDDVRPTGRGLEAWIELHHEDDQIPIVQGLQNIMSPRAMSAFVDGSKHIEDVDFKQGLRIAFNQLLEEQRDPSVTVDLTLIEPEGLEWVIEPLIEKGGNTRLIAAGGSGKSIMAMALSLAIATGSRKFLGLTPATTGPVLYLDWETNAGTHAQRIRALCDPIDVALPDHDQIIYQYHASPLVRAAQSVRKTCDKYGVVMVVVDSMRMAAGPSGQSSGEDSTLGLYAALREVAVPALLVDHKTKEDISKGKRGGYGSIYLQNLARMEWEMTKYQRPSKGLRRFELSLEKENNVGDLAPIGFELRTEGGASGISSARFGRIDPSQLMSPGDANLIDRISTLMMGSNEPITVKMIADMTDVADASIRTTLNNNRGSTFERVGSGRKGLWKLVDDYGTDDGHQPPLEEEPPKGDEWEPGVF